jgi:hypothetical protein
MTPHLSSLCQSAYTALVHLAHKAMIHLADKAMARLFYVVLSLATTLAFNLPIQYLSSFFYNSLPLFDLWPSNSLFVFVSDAFVMFPKNIFFTHIRASLLPVKDCKFIDLC